MNGNGYAIGGLRNKDWLTAVKNSKAAADQKQIMSRLFIDTRNDGDVVCTAHIDDAHLLTSDVKSSVKRLLVNASAIYFSIRTEETQMPKENNSESREASQFRKKLGWLIKEQPDAVRMKVTPEMAAVMLERNESDDWKNRPKVAPLLKRLTRIMEEDRWIYTGQTIIFTESGHLANGQHTLGASVKSGKTIEVLVSFGVQDEAFKFMDSTPGRSPGEVFGMAGIKNAKFAASVAALVWAYDNNPNWTGSTGASNNPERDELLEFYWEHEDIQAAYAIANQFGKARLLSRKWSGAMYYICSRKNEQMATEFFHRVATGLGINSARSPANAARKALLKNATAQADSSEASVALAAKLIVCWNSYRRDEQLSIARWRTAAHPDKKFPRAI